MKSRVTDITHDFRSALENDPASAEPILKRNPELINHAVYGDTESALHFFAVENRIDVVTWLLAHGGNPDGLGTRGFPLHESAQLGNIEMCRLLIGGGADPDLPDNQGETALHKASSSAYLEIIELLLSFGANPMIRDTCGELPIDQSPPRKRAKVQAIFDQHAQQTKNKKHNKIR